MPLRTTITEATGNAARSTDLMSLPVEILLEIANYLVPQSDLTPIVGENAAWTDIKKFNNSLWVEVPKVTKEQIENHKDANGEDEQEKENQSGVIERIESIHTKKVSVYSPLIALRSSSTCFNSLCTPLLYRDLNLLDDSLSLEQALSRIEIYSQHIKTVRISFQRFMDADVGKILGKCTSTTSVLLYSHYFDGGILDIYHPWQRAIINVTGEAIMCLFENGCLESLGMYSTGLMMAAKRRRGALYKDDAVNLLLRRIGTSEVAKSQLKRVDLCVGGIHPTTYDVIRRELPALESLTFHYVLRKPTSNELWIPNQHMGTLTHTQGHLHETGNGDENDLQNRTTYIPNQPLNWLQYPNLTRLQLRRCSKGYAPYIPLLVAHFAALKHLLISVCGQSDDVVIPSPSKGWYTSPTALWRIRTPLDTFHIEHTIKWEIGCMAEIPVKTLIITNLKGEYLVDALNEDENYFPMLEVMRIEPEVVIYEGYDSDDDVDSRRHGRHPFNQENLVALSEYCRRRKVVLKRDARKTMSIPIHF